MVQKDEHNSRKTKKRRWKVPMREQLKTNEIQEKTTIEVMDRRMMQPIARKVRKNRVKPAEKAHRGFIRASPECSVDARKNQDEEQLTKKQSSKSKIDGEITFSEAERREWTRNNQR